MKPRLLNLAAAVSLLLAIAIVALWVRSYWRREAIIRYWYTRTERCFWIAESGCSSIDFKIVRIAGMGLPSAPRLEYQDFTTNPPMDPHLQHWFPIPPVRVQQGAAVRWELTVAYWLLLPPTLVLPAIALARNRRRRHREGDNLCPTCGYDRRAHRPTDPCPECGTLPASSASRAAT